MKLLNVSEKSGRMFQATTRSSDTHHIHSPQQTQVQVRFALLGFTLSGYTSGTNRPFVETHTLSCSLTVVVNGDRK